MPNPARIAVLLDYQNVWLVGHGQYGRGCESFQSVPEPAKLADLIASRRDVPSKATAIGVFRGRPDPGMSRGQRPRMTSRHRIGSEIRGSACSDGPSPTAAGR